MPPSLVTISSSFEVLQDPLDPLEKTLKVCKRGKHLEAAQPFQAAHLKIFSCRLIGGRAISHYVTFFEQVSTNAFLHPPPPCPAHERTDMTLSGHQKARECPSSANKNEVGFSMKFIKNLELFIGFFPWKHARFFPQILGKNVQYPAVSSRRLPWMPTTKLKDGILSRPLDRSTVTSQDRSEQSSVARQWKRASNMS